MLAAVTLIGAACGGSNDTATEAEVSAGAQPQASSPSDAVQDEAAASGDDRDDDAAAGDDVGEGTVEAPSEDDPSSSGETSSASSGEEDGASSSAEDDGASADGRDAAASSSDDTDDDAADASDAAGSGDADDASDVDDTVSTSNDGGQSSDGQSDSAGEQPVVEPDGTETFGPQEGEREHAEIIDVQKVVRESWPLQLAVIIAGEMRDGCQELAWEMRPEGSTYHISVWQVVPPANAAMACTMAIVPFDVQIELGTSEAEDFTVIVNDIAY